MDPTESDRLSPKNKYPISISWPRNNKKRCPPPHRREQLHQDQQQHQEQHQEQIQQDHYQELQQSTSNAEFSSTSWKRAPFGNRGELEESDSLEEQKQSEAMDLSGNSSTRILSRTESENSDGAIDIKQRASIEGMCWVLAFASQLRPG